MSDDLDNIQEPEELENQPEETSGEAASGTHFQDKVIHTTVLGGMYKDWFLDYASYVILERAVPHINDGLKPVQRRIFHSMRRLDDGRFNKVANIIGHTMQFHPHGDASIGDALVQLGQKELAVECQGNWGNIFTGDSAAAPRYIEARLSKFAMEVVFNPKTTEWKLSYDGRNKEPITLPMKFPLLLAQGVEGIAVGLASKILPHNFNELLDASIAVLKNEPFTLYPDFTTGGFADVSRYNDGLRGGAVKVRAKINKLDKKTLVINDIPFGKTTSTLIESILKANDKGKIKIRKIDDNTSDKVEILVHLQPGISPDVTIDALYAFTDCEISISPNCCVIDNDRPRFIGVSEILRVNTNRTLELLRQELEIRMNELLEDWHLSSLEKVFFEEKIYRELERETESWEQTIDAINVAFNPFRPRFKREITREDLLKLTEKPVRRISRFDIKKADEFIKGLEKEMEQVQYDLDNIVPYTINWFKNLKKKYGADKQRLTELRNFESIEATAVIANNEKLYINRVDGFIGTNLKKDEFVCDCSDIDDILVIRRDGAYLATKVAEKTFVGKDILYVSVFRKNDTRTIFNVIYFDGESGFSYVKRCAINGLTRDKEYNLSQGTPYSKILYLTVNPNGEAETVKVKLKPRPRLKVLDLIFNFAELAVKGRNALGNILTKHAIHKIELKEKGISTMGGATIWFDNDTFRLNSDERGTYLGQFIGNEKILVLNQKGEFYTSSYELTNHFDDDIVFIEKYTPDKVFSIVYFDAEQQFYYVKRCTFEMTDRPQNFIDDNPKSKLILLSVEYFPQFKVDFGGKHKGRPAEIIDVEQFIGVKSFRAKGRRLTTYEVKGVIEIEPLQKEIPVKPEEKQETQGGIADIKEEDVFKNTAGGNPIEPSLF